MKYNLSSISRLAEGKESEAYISGKLTDMGFSVKDISMEKFITPEGEFFSPFDLLVSSEFFTFLVDVKRRNHNVPIGIPINRMKSYDLYNKYEAEDKLIIFHFYRRSKQDCMYMSMESIKQCIADGPFYHIEQYQLLSIAVLRKILERYSYDD